MASGDISTALSASGKSVGGLVATLSGSGTAAFRSLVVDGVNPLAFPEFIARADQFGKDIDAAKTAGFAPDIAGVGQLCGRPGRGRFHGRGRRAARAAAGTEERRGQDRGQPPVRLQHRGGLRRRHGQL